MSTLIIAEKRSVGEAIAAVVNSKEKKQGYYAGKKYLVSWAKGHLVEAATPEQYNPSYAKWKISDLPIIPDSWSFNVSQNSFSKQQYEVLNMLMKSENINEIICATDAGREGELIFRLIYNKTGCKKPVYRLWISSIEEQAIKDGLAALKPCSEYDNLYAAANARLKADWLVGMNLTRLYSCQYNTVLHIGRVQTPTVNLIVERQKEIDSFQPQPYYVVTADCGSFKATTKVNEKRAADEIASRCDGHDAYIAKIEQEKKGKSPPPLYDLTALQRDANRMFGYAAQQTLQIVQTLYDNKLATYPRTDSRFITSDMEQTTQKLLNALVSAKKIINSDIADKYDVSNADIRIIVNDAKVTDHHALLPTMSALDADISQLPEEQQIVLRLITYRLLCAVYPPHRYMSSKVYLDIEGEAFTAIGKQTIDVGFTEIELLAMKSFKCDESGNKDEKKETSLPSLSEGDKIPAISISIQKKETKPPLPYTEDTLLSALEHAGADIADKELKTAIKGSGLGTPATRAGVIEKIIEQGFVERRGNKKTKTLHPAKIAVILMGIIPEDIKSAVMTAEWESKLSFIQYGALQEENFILDITEYITKIIDTSKMLPLVDNPFQEFVKAKHEVMGQCPRCGSDVYEGAKTFYCSNQEKNEKGTYMCGFSMWKEDKFFAQRKKTLTADVARDLLAYGRSVLKGCKPKDKTKRSYDINIFLEDTGKYVNYKWEFLS